MIIQDFDSSFKEPIIGVDEVGKGSWSGPVVAGAFWLHLGKNKQLPFLLNDSKKLSSKKRQEVLKQLFLIGKSSVGIASAKEIDKVGISLATWLAMDRAIKKLLFKIPYKPSTILIDGILTPKLSNTICFEIKTIKKGDEKSPSIAAASIVAKEHRDDLMKKLDKKFSGYEWFKNKGYGTKNHMEALMKLGPTQEHRKSFKPMKLFFD